MTQDPYSAAPRDAGDPDMQSLSRAEVLASRLIDGEASDREWDEFRALAGRDSCALWRTLAEAQRDHAVLGAALGEQLTGVDLPRVQPGVRERAARLGAISGWSLAAGLALVWGLGWAVDWRAVEPGSGGVAIEPAVASSASVEDAWDAYLRRGAESGTVVGEVPRRVVVHTEPRDDGTYDVTFVRQVLERRRITDVYRMGQDEAGEPVLVPASLSPTPAGAL